MYCFYILEEQSESRLLMVTARIKILVFVVPKPCSYVGICQRTDVFSMCHLRWVKDAQEEMVDIEVSP